LIIAIFTLAYLYARHLGPVEEDDDEATELLRKEESLGADAEKGKERDIQK
jgi:hypothetical protein